LGRSHFQQACGCSSCRQNQSCVEGMSNVLKYFINRKVVIYEDSGNIVMGRLKDVRNGVATLEYSIKFLVHPLALNGEGIMFFERLYISICKIEEFAEEDTLAVPVSESGGRIPQLIQEARAAGVCDGEPWKDQSE
jgi:hypothetical protein